MKLKDIRSGSLFTLYSIISFLTEKIRFKWLIQLKILIGLAIIGNKTSLAQEVTFPNQENKSDTLQLDVELKSNAVMCYEVVVVDYKNEEPKYYGGQRALNRFVRKNVKYPQEAIIRKIEGEISVNVTINAEGDVLDAQIISGLGYGLDEEVLRLARKLPRFKPGKVNKIESIMNKTLIFHFELP